LKKNSEVEFLAKTVLFNVLLSGLVLYLAWQLAGLTWFLVAPQENESFVYRTKPGASVNFGKLNANGQWKAATFHLFGEPSQIDHSNKVAYTPKVVPQTRLNLILLGVVTSERKDESSAIVAEIGRDANYYRVGDTLPGNAVLEEVLHDRILLRRNGGWKH
jgi:general secretion pathway protein C